MRYSTILALTASLGLSSVHAQDIDGDFPSACQDSCGAVQQQANSCDNQNNNDSAELQCICKGQNMQNLVPQCQACIAENSNSPDDLDGEFCHCHLSLCFGQLADITEILNGCDFARATSVSGSAAPTITQITTTYTETDDDGNTELETDRIIATVYNGSSPVFSTYTTTRVETDDDGDVETDTDIITSQMQPTGAPRSTVVTSTNDSGSTTVVTSRLPPATGGSNSNNNNNYNDNSNDSSQSSSGNGAAATAGPLLGAGAGAILAALVAL
jgi:hypothetical protein